MSAKKFHDLVDDYYRTNKTEYLECLIRLASAVRLERECDMLREDTSQEIIDRASYLAAIASRDEDSPRT